jgi:uncharacterized protein YceK
MNQRQHNRQCLNVAGPWAALALLVIALVSGCDTIFKQSTGDATTGSHPGAQLNSNDVEEQGSQEVAGYLDFMDVLDTSDEQGWHTIFAQTLSAYQKDPTRESRLRFALVMSRADIKSEEPKITRDMLTDSRKLFDETAHGATPSPPLVRKFAGLMLTEIDARLALYDELRSLRSQLAKAHQASQTANRDRTEAEARMRRIDAALSEANAKLEAVMKIERNIGPTGKETFP